MAEVRPEAVPEAGSPEATLEKKEEDCEVAGGDSCDCGVPEEEVVKGYRPPEPGNSYHEEPSYLEIILFILRGHKAWSQSRLESWQIRINYEMGSRISDLSEPYSAKIAARAELRHERAGSVTAVTGARRCLLPSVRRETRSGEHFLLSREKRDQSQSRAIDRGQ